MWVVSRAGIRPPAATPVACELELGVGSEVSALVKSTEVSITKR